MRWHALVLGGSMLLAGVCPAGAQPADKPPVLPKACVSDVMRAARWFVRQLDAGAVAVESGPGWQAWRGTTADEDLVLPVLWIKIEQIPESSKSAGGVSGWIELDGAPPGMAVPSARPLGDDELPVHLPESYFARATGSWRLSRALVDGTPKEQAMVIKALDKCAAALSKPPRRR
jgi:hypothetical protein